MSVFENDCLLHKVGQQALDKYLEQRPSTALFYDLFEADKNEEFASKIEDYSVASETKLRVEMRNIASTIRDQIEPGMEADLEVRLQALASQVDISLDTLMRPLDILIHGRDIYPL